MTEHKLFDEFGNDSGVVIRVGIDTARPQDVDVLYHPPGEDWHWWFGQDDGSYRSREILLALARRLDALRAAAQQADPAQAVLSLDVIDRATRTIQHEYPDVPLQVWADLDQLLHGLATGAVNLED